MEIALNIGEEDAAYLSETTIESQLTAALESVARSKPLDPVLALIQYLEENVETSRILVQGIPVQCTPGVVLSVGPVVGEVTHDTAIVLVEVKDNKNTVVEITCHLYKKGEDEEVLSVTHECHSANPKSFQLADLEPGTAYTAVFSGISGPCAKNAFALFQTKPDPAEMRCFKIIALSCDRPDRLMMGQKNPWDTLVKKAYGCDVMLHLGDQVYNKDEDDENTEKIFSESFDTAGPEMQSKMKKRARALMRKKYRTTWNKKSTRQTFQRGSHLMIWSDNDVANDFTTLKKEEGEQAYAPEFLKCGIEVYRQYQRILWDPEGDWRLPDDPNEYFNEFHSHIYGPVGIFLMDMRGNRITAGGVQQSENPLVSHTQWEAIEEFFSNPDLKVIIICSEIPFVGDEPEVIKENASSVDFLKDHWPYNTEELVRLLDLCFNWKAECEDGREVLMMGGDIHVGVTSIIRDSQTDLTITHLTTSPITNHVTKFYPKLSGAINDRYTFDHMPLGRNQRNYAEVVINLEDKDSVDMIAQLKPISTDMFKDTEWMSDDDDIPEADTDQATRASSSDAPQDKLEKEAQEDPNQGHHEQVETSHPHATTSPPQPEDQEGLSGLQDHYLPPELSPR